MFTRAILVAGAVMFVCAGQANAGISDDLRFCSSLKNSKERLACYDAAARIENHKPAIPARMRLDATPATKPAPHPVATKSPFDGAYVGIVGGYDFNVSDPYVYDLPLGASFPIVPDNSIRGGKIGGTIGYNLTSGPILAGFEARAFYNFGDASQSVTHRYPGTELPYISSWSWCSSPCVYDPRMDPTSYAVSSTNTYTLKRSRPWQADFSVRTGLIFDDWLVYARTGLGFEQTEAVTTNDNTASVTCNSPIVEHRRPNPNELAIAIVGCAPGGTSHGAVSTTVTRSYNPTAILGAGFERNFGQWFARVEGEMMVHFADGYTYYSPSANMAIGYRF